MRILLGIIFLTFLLSGNVRAENQYPSQPGGSLASQENADLQNVARLVTKTTGISMSPLVSVTAIGAYTYMTTPVSKRALLPWYANSYVWGSCLLLLVIFAGNAHLGTFIPFAHKPIQAVEHFEHYFSSIVLAFPLIISTLQSNFSTQIADVFSNEKYVLLASASESFIPHHTASTSTLMLISIVSLLVIPSVIFVMLLSQALNTLILLSPIPQIDIVIRFFRFSILCLLLVGTLIHPYIGAAISLVILLIAWKLAGWSFRLSTVGAIFTLDLISRRSKRTQIHSTNIMAFTSSKIPLVPARTLGWLDCNDSALMFHYKPLGIFPKKCIRIQTVDLHISENFVNPTICSTNNQIQSSLFFMPPRFKGHGYDLANRLNINKVTESPYLRGWKYGLLWLKNMFFNMENKFSNSYQRN